MPRGVWVLDPRTCLRCYEKYTPTGTSQKYCEGCRSTYYSRYRQDNRQELARKQKEYVRSVYYPAHQRKMLQQRLKTWASPEEIERVLALWDARSGLCEICGKSEEENGRALAVDHCHETLTFRGFLCSACNSILGWFQDRPEILESAKSYLLRHRDDLR